MPPPTLDTRDGIVTFTPGTDPQAMQRVSLVFRAGMADETLPTAGTLELLALYALEIDPPPCAELSMSLGPYTLSIDVTAPPEDLAGLLAAIIDRLRQPSAADLQTMAALMSDDPLHEPTPEVEALLNRYGADGPGLTAFRGAGLRALRPEHALALGRRAFVRGNVALASDARLPADLRVALPEGPRWPAVEPETSALRYPVGYPHQSQNDIIVTAMVPHGEAADTASRVLTARVTRALRHELGVVYSPVPVVMPLAHHDLIGVRTDVPPAHADTVVATIFQVIMDLAGDGPTEEELREDAVGVRDRLTRDFAGRVLPWVQAHRFLADEAPPTLAGLRLETLTITPAQVRAVAREMITTAMMGVPGETLTSVAQLNWESGPNDRRPAGRRFDYRRGVLPTVNITSPSFVLTGDGVLFHGAATGVAVPLAEAAAMYAWPDGARRLIRRDAYSLVVDPRLIARGDDLVRQLDLAVPRERVIPQAPRDPADLRVIPGALERLLLPARPSALAGIAFLLLVLTPLLAVTGQLVSGFFPMMVVTAILLAAKNIPASASEREPVKGTPRPGAQLTHPAARSGPDDRPSEEA